MLMERFVLTDVLCNTLCYWFINSCAVLLTQMTLRRLKGLIRTNVSSIKRHNHD